MEEKEGKNEKSHYFCSISERIYYLSLNKRIVHRSELLPGESRIS
jgi:hypothetical protein